MKRKNFYHKNKLNLQSIDVDKIETLTKELSNSYPKSLKEFKAVEDLACILDDLINAYETDKESEKSIF